MKYNSISSSSSSGEGKKSTLTIYADLNLTDKNQDSAMETEVSKLKAELLQAQNALDKQTRKCRKLVEEFTRRLQEKEFQYKYEKNLREDQLAKVLRTLLLVEARLKQEQKLILQQLKAKDFIIQKQHSDISKLLSCQYCKNCSQYSNPSLSVGSLDSSSEYMVSGNQESNFGSLDSTELYATMSDKDSSSNKSDVFDDSGSSKIKFSTGNVKPRYQKNKGQDSLERKFKKFSHRKSTGNYFEVLKLRDDNASPFSNEDNTSNDYDNFDSLPTESLTDGHSMISQDSENLSDSELVQTNDIIFNNHEAANNLSLSESNITVIYNIASTNERAELSDAEKKLHEKEKSRDSFSENNLSDSIPVFDVEGESNDKWYVSASDQEDEEQKNVYRNNPVLECVNQILLRNITLNSPPKTPNVERKSTKNKRVKFNVEEIVISDQVLTEENLRENDKENENQEYYETPIQKVPNFYETPQSIYSNDYEQIISISNESLTGVPCVVPRYKQEEEVLHRNNNTILRKNKILRTPPALPPKPANLASKYKIQDSSLKLLNDKSSDSISLDSEPDYCSISELNLPTNRIPSSKKIQVCAEINAIPSKNGGKLTESIAESNHYDPVNEENTDMIMKDIEKVNIQVAKQTIICSEDSNAVTSPTKLCQSIPKLPLVSEIIIPEEGDKEKEEMISQDNYVKNNSQMRKILSNTPKRRPLSIGSSVSSLIMGFNNRELMDELTKEPIKPNPRKRIISSLENLQNIRKQYSPKAEPDSPNHSDFIQSRGDFSLDQNFEEFKLEDCEIEEYTVDIPDSEENGMMENKHDVPSSNRNIEISENSKSTEDVLIPNLKTQCVELFKQQLEKQKNESGMVDSKTFKRNNEPSYEHFLECTGLSSKSILTPSRIPTNHKTVLKPKDIKGRSKSKANNYFDNTNGKSIKYWSEPFI